MVDDYGVVLDISEMYISKFSPTHPDNGLYGTSISPPLHGYFNFLICYTFLFTRTIL